MPNYSINVVLYTEGPFFDRKLPIYFSQVLSEFADGKASRERKREIERERESDKMTVTDGEKRRKRRERASH